MVGLLLIACLLCACSATNEGFVRAKENVAILPQTTQKSETLPVVIENIPIETVSGEYRGLADNNFFEVKIASKAESYKVFMITDQIRPGFEKLSLKKNALVEIDYIENRFGQLEVQGIRLIKQPE